MGFSKKRFYPSYAGWHGIEVRVSAVQRTGPVVRASAEIVANGTSVSVELPHLHHDAARFQAAPRSG